MMKVLFLDTCHPLLRDKLEAAGLHCEDGTGLTEHEAREAAAGCCGIVIRSRFHIGSEFLGRAAGMKFVARYGSGMENIDVPYAEQKGIACLSAPEGNRDAVADHALGMLLAVMNNICKADREVRGGQWDREGNRGSELTGKTVAVIGYGNTGSAFAQRLRGFDARVLAYDKYVSGFSSGHVKEAAMDEIFADADVLSLHVPLTPETEGLVSESYMGRFVKEFYLVNTSRGQVVNTGDLVKSLQSGKVRGAGLDVLEYERTSFESLSDLHLSEACRYLLAADNVVLTPHVAGWSHESYRKLAEVLAEKILKALGKYR